MQLQYFQGNPMGPPSIRCSRLDLHFHPQPKVHSSFEKPCCSKSAKEPEGFPPS